MKNRQENPGGREDSLWPLLVVCGEGRTAVRLELLPQGHDLVLRVTGGRAHIGAVAVCDFQAGRAHVRVGERTIQLPGHREGSVAAEAAESLAAATQHTCVAVVGIHQDDATPAEIHHIVSNVRQGLQQVITAYNRDAGEEV